MKNSIAENLKNTLPTNIAQGLESALAYLPGGKTATIEKPQSEG